MHFKHFSTLFLALTLLASLHSKEITEERAPAATACPSPEEAQKMMTVPDGYAVRCFAHEPMVKNPVAMTWDSRGRLWVVEAYEYPEGSPLKNKPFGGEALDDKYQPVPATCSGKSEVSNLKSEIPRDRVVILEDTDNDGVADKRTVFVEGLNLASAILCGDGGIYVGQQPHLLHFKDTDGDDHADEWRVCLTGFGREDTHELVNSFCWGPDGWLYMTHGVFTNSKVRRPGVPAEKGFKFDAGIGRCKPLTGEFEVFADGTSNPWGCDYDARGNFFVSACVIDHFFHMAPGGIYVRQGGAPENPYSYELLPSIVTHKHFRAAYAGVQIYQGGVYSPDTWGHAFIGNIHDNAIHEEVLTPVGATFKCEPRRDFLRANNGWFRPVSTQTGPDGNLWIMDWCDKYPCYQNAKANPEGVDREKGRIWRVVAQHSNVETNAPAPSHAPAATIRESGDARLDIGMSSYPSRPTTEMDLKKLTTPELVKLLEHPNNWMRRMARRMLVERKDEKAKPLLEALVRSSDKTEARMEALWSMYDTLMMDDPEFSKLVKFGSPAIKLWCARYIGEIASSCLRPIPTDDNTNGLPDRVHEIMPWLITLAKDPDPSVRMAVAIACRQIATQSLTIDRGAFVGNENSLLWGVIRNLISSSKDTDVALTFAIWMAYEPQLAAYPKSDWLGFQEVLFPSKSHSRTLAYKSMRRLCDTRDARNIDLAIAFCDKIKEHDALLAQALEGLVKGQGSGVIKPTIDVSRQLAAWRKSSNSDIKTSAQQLAVLWGDKEAIAEMMVKVQDANVPLQERISALQIVRKAGAESIRDGLEKLLNADTPELLLIETIRATGDAGGDNLSAMLVERWSKASPPVRIAIAEVLTSRPAWAVKLLDAVSDKRIPRADVPITVSRYFATQKDEALKKRAEELIGAWKESNADTKALIAAKRRACLEGEPDLAMGKLLFQGTCAVCHTFHGGGQKVGPELIGSGRSNLDAILANVIDPNQIIGNGYEAINIITRDNRTVSGRLVEDTPSYVKLLAIGGSEQVVPRDQIARLENTHQSLMPMGFGALPDDAFRSLIWYVLAPPEEGPLTKEQKAALSASMDMKPSDREKKNPRSIDWESVSLWNPDWKVSAPDFERTPVKLAEFHGRHNVLLMHPFDEKKPASLERTMTLEAGKPHQLTVNVAAHDQGDWELRILVNGEVIKKATINHDGERWKTVTVDLSAYAGKEVKLRLEGAATGWAWEFGYWSEIKVE